MNYKKFLAAASAALMILTVTLMLAPGAWAASKYKVLYAFKGGADGIYSEGGLIFDGAGNLYGVTAWGQGYTGGTIFELTPNADGRWKHSVLYSLNGGSDGDDLAGGLVFDASGSLYGTAVSGGDYGYGTVYRLAPNSDGTWTFSVLHSFTGSDGNSPREDLTFDTVGNLYGMTWAGGAQGHGVVFELTPNTDGTWTESVLYSFTGGKDGGTPDDPRVIFDAAGNLYGAAGAGGTGTCNGNWGMGCGVILELTSQADGSWKEKVLYRFKGGKDGAVPEGLIFDQAGTTLYGVTAFGGGGPCTYTIPGCGTVFKLTPNSHGGWTEGVLHRFQSSPDGANPWASPIFDTAGNLYGTTLTGGSGGCWDWMNGDCGTVFKLTPNSRGGWTEHVLHRFGQIANHPLATGVILDSQGNLYGEGEGEYTNSVGAVFEITP